jgi:hypothetical protein
MRVAVAEALYLPAHPSPVPKFLIDSRGRVHHAPASLSFCMLHCGIEYDLCCGREKVAINQQLKKFDGRNPSTQLK